MNKYILFAITIILCSACGSDGPDVSGDRIVLSYDGENVTAPTLGAGYFEFAVRFPTMLTDNAIGKSIEQVSFYLYDAPQYLAISISNDLTSTLPDDVLFRQQITAPRTNSWNTITLSQPFEITGEPIWVRIEIEQNDILQTVGCDAGPNRRNGDWLYDEDTNTWESFLDRTGQAESVNWNIKAILSE